ncbi:hypothetical protein ACROYT_G032966 [Oculina patagonica]
MISSLRLCIGDMKISLTKVLITLLLYIDVTFPERIKITRSIPERDPEYWEDVVDSFHLPQSVCHDESRGDGNSCDRSCEIKQGAVAGSEVPYSCRCSEKSATVTYLNNKWRCLENKVARTQLGCETNIFFDGEKRNDGLRTLNTAEERETKLESQANCKVNISSSWYIGCDGEKVPLGSSTNKTMKIFLFEWDSDEEAYFIKVVEPINIFVGRVINLGISCSEPGPKIKESCLLFKLEGSFTCPVKRSTSPIFSSTINPTTSSLIVTSLSTAYSEKATVPATTGPTQHTQAITQPNSGRRQKNEDDSSSSSLGIIAGVTVSISLVLVVIAALFIYRCRISRKDANTSTSGQINKNTVTSKPKTKSAFQPQEQNGFVTNNGKEPFASIYAPNYDVPQSNSQSGGLYAVHNISDGHNIFGPRDSQEEMSQNNGLSGIDQPVYNILEDLSVKDSEETVNNGLYEPETVYNVLEEPYTEGSEGPEWYGSVPMEGPVYNTLEEPYAEGSEGPAWYGSVPVDGPVYNTLEEPNQYADSPSTNEPVYNVP